jgi:hypothetical protein
VSGDKPDGWEKWMYVPGASTINVENGEGHNGSKFISIESNEENDARLKQAVPVKENATYKLSCWAKTENVGQQKTGAIISIMDFVNSSRDLKGTNDKWQQLVMYARIGSGINSIEVSVGLGGYGNMNTGKAYFDDLAVEEITTVPDGVQVAQIDKQPQNNTQPGGSEKSSGSNSIVIILSVAAVAVIGGIAYFIFARRPKKEDDGEESDTGDYDEGEYEEEYDQDDDYIDDNK